MRDAFFEICVMWDDQLQLELYVRPRTFKSSVVLLKILERATRPFFGMRRLFVFSKFKRKPFSQHHSLMCDTSLEIILGTTFKSETGMATNISSAYLTMIAFDVRGFADFICKQKRNGAITDPCGTPEVMFMRVDDVLSRITFCWRFWR